MACVGGGSNAIGLFHPFLGDEGVRTMASRPRAAAWTPPNTPQRSTAAARACCTATAPTCCRTAEGQITEAHSISAGLDYPGIGPEHAFLHDVGRVTYLSATDEDALDAFQPARAWRGSCRRWNSPTPWRGWARGRIVGPDGVIVLNLSGRGDKDLATVAAWAGPVNGVGFLSPCGEGAKAG